MLDFGSLHSASGAFGAGDVEIVEQMDSPMPGVAARLSHSAAVVQS